MEACGIGGMGGERKARVEGGGSGCGGEMAEFARGYCDERLFVAEGGEERRVEVAERLGHG